MIHDSDSDTRCLKAVELTVRFVVTCAVPLAFLLFVVCMCFGREYEPGVNVGMAIVVLYFVVAYHNVHRNNKILLIIAELAGLTTIKTVGSFNANANAGAGAGAEGFNSSDADDSGSAINPATGLMMIGGFDTAVNTYGSGTISGGFSNDDISMFGDNHHSFNQANGLPMMDDVTDIHGNIFGTTSVDDVFDHSSSTFDDSVTHSLFDDSLNSSSLDDDWNK